MSSFHEIEYVHHAKPSSGIGLFYTLPLLLAFISYSIGNFPTSFTTGLSTERGGMLFDIQTNVVVSSAVLVILYAAFAVLLVLVHFHSRITAYIWRDEALLSPASDKSTATDPRSR